MEITTSRTSAAEIREGVLVVPVFEGDSPLAGALASLDHLAGGSIEALFDSDQMSGKRDRWVMLHKVAGIEAEWLMLYGGGSRGALDSLSLQRLSGSVVRTLASRGVRSAILLVTEELSEPSSVRAIVEGAIVGSMNGDLYRSNGEAERGIERLVVVPESPDAPDFSEAIHTGVVMAAATNFARALTYEPGNVMTPTELALRAQQMAEREGLGFEALGEDEMKRLGMGALLAVSKGSSEPARLIVISYESSQANTPELIALIGKGITFDSGGISIKPAEKMDEMKYDMGAGAAVIAAMQIIARLRPAVRVIGLVPASENLPSGRAVKPGDIVRSLSGKTIEVVNTDAEGRLVLADAITYAIHKGATQIVDAATLTGACVISLGEVRAAVMGNDQELIDDLIAAGEQCGERLWQMPLDCEYGEMIRSEIADVKNVGNRTAGAVTAAYFLKHFSGPAPWAHLDIAGTAWMEQAKPYIAKGATGFGARLMANFVLNRANSRK